MWLQTGGFQASCRLRAYIGYCDPNPKHLTIRFDAASHGLQTHANNLLLRSSGDFNKNFLPGTGVFLGCFVVGRRIGALLSGEGTFPDLKWNRYRDQGTAAIGGDIKGAS